MSKLINVFKPAVVTENPAFTEEEVELLSAVITQLLDNFEREAIRGTIILDGQRDGSPANLLYKCNLESGAFSTSIAGKRVHTSDDLAALAIDEMLKPLTDSCYRYSFKLSARNDKDAVPSAIYRWHELTVLVINARGGRILGSAYLQDWSGKMLNDESIVLLMSLKVALEAMFPSDVDDEEFLVTDIEGMSIQFNSWRYMCIKRAILNMQAMCDRSLFT